MRDVGELVTLELALALFLEQLALEYFQGFLHLEFQEEIAHEFISFQAL